MSLPEVFHQYQLAPRFGDRCEDDGAVHRRYADAKVRRRVNVNIFVRVLIRKAIEIGASPLIGTQFPCRGRRFDPVVPVIGKKNQWFMARYQVAATALGHGRPQTHEQHLLLPPLADYLSAEIRFRIETNCYE
jgi:hypothetical protein